jgi:hypothetical protein
MDKKEVLLFIKDNLYDIDRLAAGKFSGKITREKQADYKAAYKFIDPKGSVCFTCGRSPQIMAARFLSYKEQCQQKNVVTESGGGGKAPASTKPKRTRKKRGSQSK